MPYKDHDRQLAAQRAHYQANKERYLENQRKRRARGLRNRKRELVQERERRERRRKSG